MKDKLYSWFQCNIDFAFVLAAFTETPRWVVAFKAIHEPSWIGVPLGVLLAFATARAWRRYFETYDQRLLVFNVASMGIAVMVIAPVLYVLTSTKADDVNLSMILHPVALGAWAMLLAVTTFLPLVQLAAVQDPVAKQETKHPSKRVTHTVSETRTVAQTEQYTLQQPELERATLTLHPEFPVAHRIIDSTTPVEIDIATMSNEQKRSHLATVLQSTDEINKSALAKQYAVARTTLQRWIDEIVVQNAA